MSHRWIYRGFLARSSFLLFSSPRLSAIYAVPFSLLVSPATLPRLSLSLLSVAAVPFATATRKLDPPKRSVELTTCRILLFVAGVVFLCSSLDFPPVRIFILFKISHRSPFFVIQLSDERTVSFFVLAQDFYTDYVPTRFRDTNGTKIIQKKHLAKDIYMISVLKSIIYTCVQFSLLHDRRVNKMAQNFPIVRSIARYGVEATEKTAWDRAARESHNYEILHPYSRMRFPLKLSANPHKCGTHSFCGAVQRNSTVDQPPLMSTQYVHYACPLSIHTVQQYVIAFVTVPRIDPRYSIVNSYLSRICGRYWERSCHVTIFKWSGSTQRDCTRRQQSRTKISRIISLIAVIRLSLSLSFHFKSKDIERILY